MGERIFTAWEIWTGGLGRENQTLLPNLLHYLFKLWTVISQQDFKMPFLVQFSLVRLLSDIKLLIEILKELFIFFMSKTVSCQAPNL